MPVNQQGGGQCFPGACNTVSQNCATATDACVLRGTTAADLTRACAAAGTKTQGQACTESATSTDCAKGLQCLNSKCEKFCNVDTDCGAGGSCAVFLQPQGAPFGAFICLYATACDPLAQNCPTAAEGCYLLSGGPGCFQAGTTAVGTACQSANQCVKGSGCLGDQQGNPACRQFCNLDGGAPTCGAGMCNPLANMAGMPVGFGGCF